MLLEEIKGIKSEKRDLRNFGLTMGIVLGILGALLWWKGKNTYTIFLMISSAFILLGLILPSILRPLQKAWMTFAVILGWFMTRLILGLLFYIVFTAIGVTGKLFGKKFLDTNMNNTGDSYWIQRESKPFNKQDYEKQF